ncbi:conserved hypothetical protein [Solidesulfovibrio fructosivorans JJ]]|uniref:Uncharacterized protein n=1 Tax=Solidesulfovibrio fructosivorans JJ] TaxID=596151 RepID=E1JX62_SOLFR|nr:hypothetical protein [Solidesulfovibrio fructosivorans]EFL51027.1 conserved hypothetical protein [Solidesulfovibrio fructosivorans JJ]]
MKRLLCLLALLAFVVTAMGCPPPRRHHHPLPPPPPGAALPHPGPGHPGPPHP